MTTQTLFINQITVDDQLQSRSRIHDATVKDHFEALQDTQVFPPVTVFHDGQHYYLSDGFHRLKAHRDAGRDRIEAKVISGEYRDAFLHALSANAEHGHADHKLISAGRYRWH